MSIRKPPIHLPSVGETKPRFRRARAQRATPVTMCGCVGTPKERIAKHKHQMLSLKLCTWCLARARAFPQMFNAAVSGAST